MTPDAADILAQLPLYVVLHDPDGRILWTSRYSHGLSPGTIDGRRADDFAEDEAERRQFWDTFRRVLSLKETCPISLEVHVPGVSGRARFSGFLSPLLDAAGNVTHVLGTCREGPSFHPADVPLLPFLLSPTERRVVEAVADGSKKGDAIGRALGETKGNGQSNSGLRVLLANLVERHVLSHTPHGYCLSEEFRPAWEAMPK